MSLSGTEARSIRSETMRTAAIAGGTAAARPKLSLRTWATPATIGAFVLMAGTGVLMFFGWRGGLTEEAHEWLSWLFLAGVVAHLVVTLATVDAPSQVPLGKEKPRGGSPPARDRRFSVRPADGPSAASPRRACAGRGRPFRPWRVLAKVDPGELENRLKARGVTATLEQSIRQISQQNDANERRLLSIVFMNH